jgi:predicted RNA binding protein YcfA (HicA-like mRNA interferase family)
VGNRDLPQLSQAEVVKLLCRLGCVELKGRGKGSHVVLRPPGNGRSLTIPKGTVKRSLLGQQIKQAGLTNEQFIEAWRA